LNISEYMPDLLMAFGACLIAFLSPGPNFVGIVSSAVNRRISGIFAAIGVSLGTTIWAIMAVTGATALLTSYPNAAIVMQFLAGCYLIWLGLKSLRSATKKGNTASISGEKIETIFQSFRKGLLIQLTNPKTALFWVSIISIVVKPGAPALVGVILIVGTTFIALVWHMTLALAFSAGPTRDLYLRGRRWISAGFGIVFTLLGLRLVLSNFLG
jgi:threonine/homoserine/homoserine lactone efflux protein